MLIIVFLIFFAFSMQSLSAASDHLNTSKIVDYINNLEDCTWEADTYGLKVINVKEFRRQKLGLRMSKPKKRLFNKPLKTEEKVGGQSNVSEGIPETFSWVPDNLPPGNVSTNKTFGCPIGTIYDQSNCGSCWAVASASALSDKFCLQSNGTINTPLSAEHIIACDKNNYGCRGGYMYYLFRFLFYNGTVTGGDYDSEEGCQTYSIWPCGGYSGRPCASTYHFTPKCRKMKCTNKFYKHKEENNTFKISSARSIYAYWDDTYARKEIYYKGPIIATFYVYEDLLIYKNGIYEHKKGSYLGGHAVKVVGWGIDNNTKYWHVANSWGTKWGENGFFRIRRSSYYNGYFEDGMYAVDPSMANATSTI